MSYHIISYHITSYHIISYHIISYHITYIYISDGYTIIKVVAWILILTASFAFIVGDLRANQNAQGPGRNCRTAAPPILRYFHSNLRSE